MTAQPARHSRHHTAVIPRKWASGKRRSPSNYQNVHAMLLISEPLNEYLSFPGARFSAWLMLSFGDILSSRALLKKHVGKQPRQPHWLFAKCPCTQSPPLQNQFVQWRMFRAIATEPYRVVPFHNWADFVNLKIGLTTRNLENHEYRISDVFGIVDTFPKTKSIHNIFTIMLAVIKIVKPGWWIENQHLMNEPVS